MLIPGWAVTIAVLIPNLLVLALPPRHTPPDPAPGRHRRVFGIIERLGQIGCFLTPFFLGSRTLSSSTIAFGVMGAALAFYYVGWIRYAATGRRYSALFEPLLGIPLPMALAPIVCFGAAGAAFGSALLGASAVALAVGHLYVSARSLRQLGL